MVVTVLAGACSGSDGAAPAVTTTAATTAPATTAPATTAPATTAPSGGAAFYEPPATLPSTAAGALIRSEPVAPLGGARGWRILYVSRSTSGAPIAVSGIVYTGAGAPSSGGRPVLSWAHGTTGLGDDCAISRMITTGMAAERLLVPLLVGAGYTVVATDYEGLGTPGDHPYLAGRAAGRNVLDAVRAAAQLPDSGVTTRSPLVVWGHSQGGGAAAWAGELHPSYAPELNLVGVAAGAPAAELASLETAIQSGPYQYFALMTVAGLTAANPTIDPASVLTLRGQELLARIRTQCTDEITRTLRGTTPAELGLGGIAGREPWAGLLDAESPGRARPTAPLLLYHGSGDDLIPPAVSEALAQRYCRTGATVERTVYPGDHTSVLLNASGDLLRWFTARLSGAPARSTCPA